MKTIERQGHMYTSPFIEVRTGLYHVVLGNIKTKVRLAASGNLKLSKPDVIHNSCVLFSIHLNL